MKKITTYTFLIMILGIVLIGCKSGSNDENKATVETTVIDKNQVTWVPDITEALAKAKATGKLLFVECYSPTCPICQSIEPYFSTPEIAEKYNTDFVSYKLDVGNAEHVKFLNDRNIWLPSFPQFLFFDGDGKLVHQGEVTATTESILSVANDAVTPEKRTGNYKTRFEKGERDFDFLVKYAVYSRLVKDTLESQKAASALFDIFPKADLNTETSWAAMKKTVTSVDNGFFQHWINNQAAAKGYEKKAGHQESEVESVLGGIIQTSILKDGKTYSTSKINDMKGFIRKAGAADYADTFVWEYEVLANLREGKKDAALKVGQNMAKSFANSGASLVYITKVFNDKYPDNGYIASATEWLKAANPLVNEKNHLAEYNYEVARLSLKAGDRELAKRSAQDALNVAKSAGLDTKKFADFASSLK
jgi:thioredoxin-related protein